MLNFQKLILAALLGLLSCQSVGEDVEKFLSAEPVSYKMWLNYQPFSPKLQQEYADVLKGIYCPGDSPILQNAKNELQGAASHMIGGHVPFVESTQPDGVILLGTIEELRNTVSKRMVRRAEKLKDEGFIVESIRHKGKKATVITSKSHQGVLYGVYHFLRLMQTVKPVGSLAIEEEPAVDLRMLNHWDNLNGSIERGYA